MMLTERMVAHQQSSTRENGTGSSLGAFGRRRGLDYEKGIVQAQVGPAPCGPPYCVHCARAFELSGRNALSQSSKKSIPPDPESGRLRADHDNCLSCCRLRAPNIPIRRTGEVCDWPMFPP